MAKKEISEKENMQLVLDGKKPAWLPCFTDACAMIGYPGALARKPDPATGHTIDVFGVLWTQTIDGPIPVNTQTQNFELKDISQWENIMPTINLASIDWEEEATMLRKAVKEDLMINFIAGTVWEQLHYMMGFEGALAALVEEPEATQECLFAFADFWIDAMRRITKYIKPDLIMFMEHVATASGLLMSPKVYREVIKPVHKRMYDAIIETGAIPEMHVDGLVEEIIPDYVDLGIKVIQPFQVFNDIEGAKREYGITAIGGWDAIGPGNRDTTTEEEARASVRLAMDSYGPTYRYCFWESGVTPRFANVAEWIKDESRSYGLNFYNR